MRLRPPALLALLLVGGCAISIPSATIVWPTDRATSSLDAQTTTLQDGNYRVDIHSTTRTLKASDTVTITGIIIGSFANPLYSFKLKDQDTSQSTLQFRLTPGNEIIRQSGASNILKLVATNVVSNQVTLVLQEHSPGVTEVSISVNGEIGETDGSGQWWFKNVTKFSEGMVITVTTP